MSIITLLAFSWVHASKEIKLKNKVVRIYHFYLLKIYLLFSNKEEKAYNNNQHICKIKIYVLANFESHFIAQLCFYPFYITCVFTYALHE